MDLQTPEHSFLCARLEAWLSSRLAAKNVSVFHRGAAQGGSSDTSFIDVEWQAGGERQRRSLVLRREPRSFQVYLDPRIDDQVRVLQALAAEGSVPVPEVFAVEQDESVIGTPFFLMAEVTGRALATFPSYNASGWLVEATAFDRERLWIDAVETLARLHRIEPSHFAFLSRSAAGVSGLQQQLLYWERYLHELLPAPRHPLLTTSLRWLQDHLPADAPTSLSWGDARLGNMMFHDQQCVAVLDWETVSLGGAEADLGWWLFYDEYFSTGLGLPRLEGLGDRDATIRLWEQVSGRRANNLHYFDVFTAFRVALTIERVVRLHASQGRVLPVGTGDDSPAIRKLARLLDLPLQTLLASGGIG